MQRSQRVKKLKTIIVVFCLAANVAQPCPVSASEPSSAVPPVSRIKITEAHGKIEEIHEGHSAPLILIRDAHAVAGAQQNIRLIIQSLIKQLPDVVVALEGAVGPQETGFLNAFPDEEILKKTLLAMEADTELTGAMVASVLFSDKARFTGLESWELYRQGYGYFLEALSLEPFLMAKVEAWEKALQRAKRDVYSAELQKVDAAIQAYERDSRHLNEMLKSLFEIHPPQESSDLFFLRQQLQLAPEEPVPVRKAVENFTDEIRIRLESFRRQDGREAGESLQKLNAAEQRYATAQSTLQSLAFFLLQVTDEQNLEIPVPREVFMLASREKRLRALLAGSVFDEMPEYIQRVKSELFQTPAEMKLSEETRIKNRVRQLIKLELDQAAWEDIKRLRTPSETALAHFPFSESSLPEWLESHFNFYENTEERDRYFLSRIGELGRRHGDAAVVMVTGGFHTEAIADFLRRQKRSFMVVRPEITNIPERNLYKQHIRGFVSWREYLKPEDGEVHLFRSFMRAFCDKLLQASGTSRELMRRMWRENIVAAGAAEEPALSKFYLSLVENENERKQDEARTAEWHKNVDRFIDSLMESPPPKEITAQEIIKTLKASYLPEAFKSLILSPRPVLPASYLSTLHKASREAHLPQRPRAELREDAEDPDIINYFHEQDPFQNLFYMDFRNDIFSHAIVRDTTLLDNGEKSSGSKSLRTFLRRGSEGFNVDLMGNDMLEMELSRNAQSVFRTAEEAFGRAKGIPAGEMSGVEFNVTIRNLVSEEGLGDTFRLAFIHLHTARSIRDWIRSMGPESVDPQAAEDLRELENDGESFFARFAVDAVQIVGHGDNRVKRIQMTNTIQRGRYHIILEADVPVDTEISIIEEKWPSLDVQAPPETEALKIKFRLLSDHPNFKGYREKELFASRVMEFREKLAGRVLDWEEATFTPWGRENSSGVIDTYKELLFELKSNYVDFDVREQIRDYEMRLRDSGIMRISDDVDDRRGSVLDKTREEFNNMALFKLDTFNQMILQTLYLMPREVALAGSWSYPTYFGRDTMLVTRALAPYLYPGYKDLGIHHASPGQDDPVQNLVQSVIDRMNEKGEVAHEEDLRRPLGHPKRLDYRMMDGEFIFPTLIADFMTPPADLTTEELEQFRRSRRLFWNFESGKRRDQKQIANFEMMRRNAAYVLRNASLNDLIGLKKVDPVTGYGDPTGNWRDAVPSMARAMYPGDVNIEWVPSALRALKMLQEEFSAYNLELFSQDDAARLDRLITQWEKRRSNFLIRHRTRQSRVTRLMKWYRHQLSLGGHHLDFALTLLAHAYEKNDPGLRIPFFTEWKKRLLHKKSAWRGQKSRLNSQGVDLQQLDHLLKGMEGIMLSDPSFHKNFAFYALGMNLEKEPLRVVNGDFSLASINRDFDLEEVRMSMLEALTPLWYGGRRVPGIGLVTANAMLANRWNTAPVRQPGESDEKEDVWSDLDERGYHGMVIWPFMTNATLSGWIRQVRNLLKKGHKEEAKYLYGAIGLIRGDMNRIGHLKNEENDMIITDTSNGNLSAAPYTGIIDSNAAQIWNTGWEINVQLELDKLWDEMESVYGSEISEFMRAARNNSSEVEEEIMEWLGTPANQQRNELRGREEDEKQSEQPLSGAIKETVRLLAPRAELRNAVDTTLLLDGAEEMAGLANGDMAPFLRLRRTLENAVQQVEAEESLRAGKRQNERLRVLDRILERKMSRMIGFLDVLAGEQIHLKPGKLALGLDFSAIADPAMKEAGAGQYRLLLNRYFRRILDRLVLSGKIDSETIEDLKESFRLSSRNHFKKILLLDGQRYFPVISGGEITKGNDDSGVVLVGIRLGENMDPRTESFARFTQLVYGAAVGLSPEDPRQHDRLRKRLLKAMLLDYDSSRADFADVLTRSELRSGRTGFLVDATQLKLMLDYEVTQAVMQAA